MEGESLRADHLPVAPSAASLNSWGCGQLVAVAVAVAVAVDVAVAAPEAAAEVDAVVVADIVEDFVVVAAE
jgi:hypothetical protein